MQSQPTILRIKRKRTDEPLDALVVESKSRRKKSRGGTGFFQFAETVEEETFWQDPALKKDLRTRISTLASGTIPASRTERNPTPGSVASPGRRYTIVKKELDQKQPASPVVHTTGQLNAPQDDDFTMYDAVPESSNRQNETLDADEMDKFLPMLQEYLKMSDAPSNITTSTQAVEDDYVWDVFYHRPAVNEWAAAANIATVSGLPPLGQYDSESESDSDGDEDDEDSNTESFYRNDYPDEDPDEDSDDSGPFRDSEELSDTLNDDIDDEEDERELNDFLAWRRRH